MRCTSEALIGSQQRDTDGLSERDIRRVVHGELAAQLPTPPHQRPMGHAFEPDRIEVSECLARSIRRELTGRAQTSKHRRDLEVDQFRGGEALSEQPVPSPTSVLPVVTE